MVGSNSYVSQRSLPNASARARACCTRVGASPIRCIVTIRLWWLSRNTLSTFCRWLRHTSVGLVAALGALPEPGGFEGTEIERLTGRGRVEEPHHCRSR